MSVTLTSINSCRCDSNYLAQLFENLPAPPKLYGAFDVLLIRKVLVSKRKPWVVLGYGRDDRFPPHSKQILAKIFRVRPINTVIRYLLVLSVVNTQGKSCKQYTSLHGRP